MGLLTGIFLGAVFLFVVAIAACKKSERDGWHRGVDEMIDAAVFTGHAEYYLDDNNVRQWRWKQP